MLIRTKGYSFLSRSALRCQSVAGFLLTVLLLFVSFQVVAQQRGGTLYGHIVDQLGALVPNATVTLTDSKGVVKRVVVNQEGAFEISGLTPGDYTLSVAALNFDPHENTKVSIALGRQRLDITLRVAEVKANVSIDSRDPLSSEASAQGGAG